MLVVIVVLLLDRSVFLAMAETALTRMSQVKAAGARRGAAAPAAGRCCGWSSHPERFLNPLLLVVLVCQLVQATLTGVAGRAAVRRARASSSPPFVNVVVVFVLAEAAPKTWAVQHPERAALVAARPVAAARRLRAAAARRPAASSA